MVFVLWAGPDVVRADWSAIQPGIRQRAHNVRRVRNYSAHDEEVVTAPMTVDEARSRLQAYLCEPPDE
jgi:hypothetical protein